MKILNVFTHESLNSELFKIIEENIFNEIEEDGNFASHRMAVSIEFEDIDDEQFPLEDLLDKFYLHIEEFLDEDDNESSIERYILGGDLEDLQKFKTIVGKRAFNKVTTNDKQQEFIELIIE